MNANSTTNKVGTFRGKAVYEETTSSGKLEFYYLKIGKKVVKNGVKHYFPKGRIVRVYLTEWMFNEMETDLEWI